MTSTYDAIMVGGGHNGLVSGAYLARSGARTGVFRIAGVIFVRHVQLLEVFGRSYLIHGRGHGPQARAAFADGPDLGACFRE